MNHHHDISHCPPVARPGLTDLPGLKTLLVIKMAVLVQAAPAFLLGIAGSADRKPILAGLVAGLLTVAGLTLYGYGQVAGVHAGTIGLAVNLSIVSAASAVARAQSPRAARRVACFRRKA